MKIVFDGDFSIISGYIAKDAETIFVGEGQTMLTYFSVKVSGGENPEWVYCKCWRSLAKKAKQIKRGDNIIATGKFEARKYTSKDGNERIGVELSCDFFSICRDEEDSKSSDSENPENLLPF